MQHSRLFLTLSHLKRKDEVQLLMPQQAQLQKEASGISATAAAACCESYKLLTS